MNTSCNEHLLSWYHSSTYLRPLAPPQQSTSSKPGFGLTQTVFPSLSQLLPSSPPRLFFAMTLLAYRGLGLFPCGFHCKHCFTMLDLLLLAMHSVTLLTNISNNFCCFQMENIDKYLTFCETKLGVPKGDQFQTVDLYEKQNMASVSTPCTYMWCLLY